MSIYQNIELYKELLFRANEMLLNPTRAEHALRAAILNKFPDADFQFQVVMIPFIVDIASIKLKLVIEIDGPIHMYSIQSDIKRQSDLEDDGYRFLRFSNEQVLKDTTSVLNLIEKAIQSSPPNSMRKKNTSNAYKYKRNSNLKTEGNPNLPDPKVLKKETSIGNVPDILTGVIFNPYEGIKKFGLSDNKDLPLTEFRCKKCENLIHSAEIRIAFRINSEFVGWCHKKC